LLFRLTDRRTLQRLAGPGGPPLNRRPRERRTRRRIDLADLLSAVLLEEGATLYARRRRLAGRTATILPDHDRNALDQGDVLGGQLPDHHLHRGRQPSITGQRVRHGDPEAARIDLREVMEGEDRVVGEDRVRAGQRHRLGVLGQRSEGVGQQEYLAGEELELAGEDEVVQLVLAHAESGGSRAGDHTVVIGGVAPQRVVGGAHGRDARSDHRQEHDA
jgi:hypothetical protein